MISKDEEDYIISICDDALDVACKNMAMVKSKQTNTMQVIYTDKEGKDCSITVYDFYYYIWKSNDTLDKIANNLLKDPSLAPVIAYFNKIQNENSIEAGVKIKIPVLQEEQSSANNRIYAIPSKQDNYGKDIMIDSKGDIKLSCGDCKTIGGQENLTQALMLRLTTASAKRIRLASYGIRQSIGDTVSCSSYLISSIEQTVRADPRVKEIEDISFRGEGDKLYVAVTYTDINYNVNTFEGAI